MKKAIVIGNCGAGKSYFSKKLAEKTGLPLVHLDVLNWRENWKSVSKDEFDRLLEAELEKEEWIIDGNYTRTIEHRMEKCDTVFWFDFSTLRSFLGVTERLIKREKRDDIGGNNAERFDIGFYRFVLTYNRKYRKNTLDIIARHPDVDVIVFKNRRQAEKYLDGIGNDPKERI